MKKVYAIDVDNIITDRIILNAVASAENATEGFLLYF